MIQQSCKYRETQVSYPQNIVWYVAIAAIEILKEKWYFFLVFYFLYKSTVIKQNQNTESRKKKYSYFQFHFTKISRNTYEFSKATVIWSALQWCGLLSESSDTSLSPMVFHQVFSSLCLWKSNIKYDFCYMFIPKPLQPIRLWFSFNCPKPWSTFILH